ncbi:peptidoglycan-binding protein [Streptomyces formicae]|uniref:peptidoglycan-binding protein n=1 Tax=Streptomyces formicae TaxID=1616117 RepID=UPI001F591D98|nr:peptidoglycan-binding domain-containing protein [Streptomyces formicae]
MTGDTFPEAPADASGRGRRRRPVRTVLIAAAVVATATAGGLAATGALGGGSDDGTAAAPSGPPSTAKVRKTTLTRTETVGGSLGYGEAVPVQAPAPAGGAKGGGTGVVTWLPAEGTTIKRGAPVYSVDDKKVPLLYGSTPLYRALKTGSEGKDVEQLERNLAELGYGGFTVDEEFTGATADAVEEWQDDLGGAETGTVAPGDAVVATGARRVADVQATSGSAAGGPVLTWTGTERIVTVDLEVQYEDLVDDGTKATVALPDGTEVDAEVDGIGTAATAAPAENGTAASGGKGASGEATIPVTLTVKDQKKLGRYQAAPVDVTLKAETREDVLAVPVNALVALREGGYALETVGAQGIEYVPVELGMFAGGTVEISGTGVTDGLVVGVPE